MDRKYGIANTNEFGLKEGQKYIIESTHTGSANVYNLKGDYLTYCRLDSFNAISNI